MGGKTIDIIGSRFGYLVVTKAIKYCSRISPFVIVEAICDCGRLINVRPGNLRSGNTKSCGCYQRRRASEGNKLEKSTLRKLLKRYSGSAKNRNLPFFLTLDQFELLVSSSCHYCGDSPSRDICLKTAFSVERIKFNGIDRMDNSLGYTPDNCVPCCTRCNYMKRDLNYLEFIRRIKHIASKF